MQTSTRHGQSTARQREHRGMASREAKGETVLVTGASGFIVSTLVRGLLDRGYTVRAGVLNPGQSRRAPRLCFPKLATAPSRRKHRRLACDAEVIICAVMCR